MPLALLLLAAPPDPIHDIRATRRSFERLIRVWDEYARKLTGVAPLYEPAEAPRPPFDMYYHLERMDRIRPNLTALLDEMREEWEFLDIEPVADDESK
jgi:hypothetical protein